MKKLFSLSLGIFCLLLTLGIPAYGDIARPKASPEASPQPPKTLLHTRLVVAPDSKVWEARLQVTQSTLQELREAMGNSTEKESMIQGVTHSSTRTILAGLFMFLSLSFTGVWLARSVQTRTQKTIGLLLFATAVIGAAAVITQANAGPPGSFYWKKLPQNLTKGAPTK